MIEDGADENARYHLVKSHQSIKQARELVDSVSEDVKNSSDVFTQLLESNRENKAQYDELMQSYREIRKEILADSFDYSVALKKSKPLVSHGGRFCPGQEPVSPGRPCRG